MIKRIFLTIFFLSAFNAQAAAPQVVVSIKPIHALTAGIMKGVGVPKLVMSPHESAHHFALTPSNATAINKSALFIWVGPGMENVLEKAAKTLAINGRVLTLLDLPNLTKHPLEGQQTDPHIWLDPANAKVIVRAISESLGGIDPDNAGIYADNASKLLIKLDQLTDNLRKELEPIKGKTYLVYHDAFQYYEKAFGLTRSIPVVKDAEHTIRPAQRALIEAAVKNQNIHCIFGEPNHGEKVVKDIADQLKLDMGFLDAINSHDESSPEAPYFAMMEEIASSLHDCLASDHTK